MMTVTDGRWNAGVKAGGATRYCYPSGDRPLLSAAKCFRAQSRNPIVRDRQRPRQCPASDRGTMVRCCRYAKTVGTEIVRDGNTIGTYTYELAIAQRTKVTARQAELLEDGESI